MDNYIGRLLDNRYEILESIGTGGMAVVYKARCHRLNRMVAIKVLKDELSVDAEFRRRFHAESQAVAMLSHPNIVNVYDVSHSENVDYIVMELIEGLTLKQYMQQKGALNWREALHLSTQIAKALEHAHSRGIIHRDIKPHNIMILKDGTVKVADFGIARVSTAQNTLTREALGSVHYISPEQAKGGKIDYRSDIYSLGVVMYEMLTGRTPYDGETPVAVAIKHINAQAELPRSVNPQIPLGLEQITMHAMAADLETRYENATMLLTDLDEFRRNPNVNFDGEADHDSAASAIGVVHVAEKGTHNTVDERRRKQVNKNYRNSNAIALVAGIICVALALVFIGYFLYSFFFADLFYNAEEKQVPNFIGMVAEDINFDEYSDFRVQIVDWQTSDTVEMGRVMDQEPDADRMVKSGASILLTVSSGPSTDTMRDLVNYMEHNARTILDNLGLKLNVETVLEPSDVISAGAVMRTIPSASEPLTSGQTVVLIVSTGANVDYIPMPGLIGMDINDAEELLEELNLFCRISYVDSEEDEGTVVYQSKNQFDDVPEGATVNLQVSTGPKEEEPEEEPIVATGETIWIPKPDAEGSVEVVVLLDGEVLYEFDVDLETLPENGIAVSPNVSGVHELEAYIDNELWFDMVYDFDTGEQIDQ